jgi:hypothetical protein
MYLVLIGWLYVTLMMAVAEATNTIGSVLGAMITFVLYGLLPVALVVYLMRTPARRKALRARQAREERDAAASTDPDAGGHAPAATEEPLVTPVRKEP